jgi:hypothetical protein
MGWHYFPKRKWKIIQSDETIFLKEWKIIQMEETIFLKKWKKSSNWMKLFS